MKLKLWQGTYKYAMFIQNLSSDIYKGLYLHKIFNIYSCDYNILDEVTRFSITTGRW